MPAVEIVAVENLRCPATATIALTDVLGIGRELRDLAIVEYVERTLPETLVAECFAVPDDAAFDLVDLTESSAEHRSTEDLAANPARAIGHHRFVLEVIVFSRFDFADEVVCGCDVGNNRTGEPTDSRFKGVATVEKDDIVTAFGDQLVDFTGGQMNTTVGHAVCVDRDFVWRSERNKLVSCLDG